MYSSFRLNVFFGLTVCICFGLVASDKRKDRPDIPTVADDAKSPNVSEDKPKESLLTTDKPIPDKEWNPKAVRLSDNPSDWPGHKKPFGSSGKRQNVDIYKMFPTPELFFRDYVSLYIPLLMRNASRLNEAFLNWGNDSFFYSRPQSHAQWIPLSRTANISFNAFMKRYKRDRLVFNDEVPFFLIDHIPLPSPLLCDEVTKVLSNTILYIGGEDQQNKITQRDVDTIRCVYAGNQDFVLVSHTQYGNKMPVDLRLIDVKKVDYVKFPSLREIAYHKGSLNPGDCIFIPSKWYYQVNSRNSSKSVDVMWYHKVEEVEADKCVKQPVEPTIAYAQFAEMKSWAAAWKNVAVHYFTSYLLASSSHDYDSFETAMMSDQKLFKNITEWNDEYEEIARELFAILDINKDKSYSLADLEALTPKLVEEIRGHIEDRVADIQEVMNDQQLELREDQAMTKEGKGSLDISGEAQKLAVESYVDNYLKVLEDVISESMDEVAATGNVPDFKQKIASRQAEIDGEVPFMPKTKPKPPEIKKTAKETAKAKIKAQQEKKKPTESAEDNFSETETYAVVDDTIEEEIFADEDEDEVPTKKQDSKKQSPPKQDSKGKQQAEKSDKGTSSRADKTRDKVQTDERKAGKKESKTGPSKTGKEGKIKDRKRKKDEL